MYSRYTVVALVLGCLSLTSAAANMLSQQDAIRIALKKNPEVIVAKKAWEAAQARAAQARAWPDPELELEYEELPELSHLGDFGERAFGVTQQIESPLKWWRRSRATRQAVEAIHLSVFEMTRLDITMQVKITYDRVILKQVKLNYAETDVQLAQDVLKKARLRLDAGDVPQLEVLRAEVEAGRAANRLIGAHNDLAVARAELNTLMGREREALGEIEGELHLQKMPSDLEALQQWALERRPDLRGIEWALASARSEQGAARAAFLPDLSLGLFRQTVREPTGKEDYWRVGLALELPLWGATRQRGEWTEARAVAEQTNAEKNHLHNQILLEVESAFLETQTAFRQVQLFEEQIVHEAESSFEVANGSYREGKATYLELLDTRRALMEVRTEYAEALFQYRTALSDLERAVGGELPE